MNAIDYRIAIRLYTIGISIRSYALSMLYNGRHLFTMVNLNVSSPLKRGMVVSALLLMLLLSACNGDPQTRQQTDQGRATLQAAIAHAQSIGVPAEARSRPMATRARLRARHDRASFPSASCAIRG